MLIRPPPPRWKPQPWPWTWSALAEPYASIARSCVFLVPMWEDGGNQRCVVTRTVLTRQAGTANAAGPFGTALSRTDGTLDHLIGPSGFRPIANPLSGYTIFGIANPSTSDLSAGAGTLLLMRKTNPWIQYGVLFNMAANGTEGFPGNLTAYNYNSTNDPASSAAGAVDTAGVDGRWHSYGSRYNGSSATTIWRDGLIRQTSSTGVGFEITDPAQIVVVGGLNAAGYGTIGGIGLVSAWDRALADWEMRALHDDPMGLVRQRPAKTFFIPSAPSAPPGPEEWTIIREDGGYLLREDDGQFFREDAPAEPSWSVSGSIAATKPTISAAAVQTFPARALSGVLAAPKPTVTATATQTFPARSVTGSFAAKKPTVTATAVQVFPARALVAALSAPKPTLTAIATVSASSNSSFSSGFNSGFGFSSPVRNLAAALIAPKPSLSAISVQVFPARSLTATLASPKPAITSVAVQTFPARSLTAVIGAKKPSLAATAAQVFPARNVAGAITANKPTVAATAVQVFPARSIATALAAPKPAAAGTATQTFPVRNLAAALLAPKPTLTAQLFQSQIGSITISSSLVAPKPTIAATATQVFPARSLAGTLSAPKPTLRGFATETRRVAAALAAPKPSVSATAVQAAIGSTSATATLAARKPTISATATQVFPARNVVGAVASKKPTLSATAGQDSLAKSVAGTLVSPKPTVSSSGTSSALASSPFTSEFSYEFGGDILPTFQVSANIQAKKPTASGSLTRGFPERLILGSLGAPKPSIAGGIIQVFPERFVSAGLGAPKPTIRGVMVRGVSQEAPELSNAVYLTGSVNPEIRFRGVFDLDVPFTAAIETDVFLTGTIDN